jgi:tripartite-type tricarboxylate transporter receptor subunit TctC
MSSTSTTISAGVIAAALLAPALAPAADSFTGKNIDLLIGAPPGGGYDIYARTLARHLGRHIPGQPTIVAKNMPGAGSARGRLHQLDRAQGRHRHCRDHAGRNHGPPA